MNVARLCLSVALMLLGGWITILNWAIFWRRHVQKRESPSWVPLLGGALLCFGFILLPANEYRWWGLLGFVVDWGGLLGIAYSIIWIVKHRVFHK